MIALWLVALLVGIAGAAFGSRRAVTGALEISDQLGVSKGLIGVTLVAIGTDLPEIANSISASVTGHGDLNVGNATGSALAQVTLIISILAFASPALLERGNDEERSLVVPTGAMTVAATLVIALVIRDGVLSRSDGVLLVMIWAACMTAVSRWQRRDRVAPGEATRSGLGRTAVVVIGWLAVVAGSATIVVHAFVEITDAIGVPELIASTVVLAIGTSLPELVVDWTAVRQGAAALALGDLFGSSLVDASLSIGIGPIFSATEVSSEAVASTLIVAVGIALATIAWRVTHTNSIALAWTLLAVYATSMGAIVLFASG